MLLLVKLQAKNITYDQSKLEIESGWCRYYLFQGLLEYNSEYFLVR